MVPLAWTSRVCFFLTEFSLSYKYLRARAQREEDKKLSVLRDAISTSYAAASGHAGSLNTPEELAEKRRSAGRKLLLAVEAAQEWHRMLAREQITVMKALGLAASAHVAVPEIDAPAPGI